MCLTCAGLAPPLLLLLFHLPPATPVYLRGDHHAGGHQVLALLCHPAVPTNGMAGVPENALSRKLTAPRLSALGFVWLQQAKEIDAKRLKQDLLGLRQKLREEREAAVKSVEMALRALYSDQEPAKVRAVTEQCVAYFKVRGDTLWWWWKPLLAHLVRNDHNPPKWQRVEDLKKLAADAGEIFPAEFSSVKPHRVHRKFVKLREDEAAQ